jgi:hypothetical protein
MTDREKTGSARQRDGGLRRMLIWVFAALIAVLAFSIVVVELMLRWFGVR